MKQDSISILQTFLSNAIQAGLNLITQNTQVFVIFMCFPTYCCLGTTQGDFSRFLLLLLLGIDLSTLLQLSPSFVSRSGSHIIPPTKAEYAMLQIKEA